jgi:hypothetical protein
MGPGRCVRRLRLPSAPVPLEGTREFGLAAAPEHDDVLSVQFRSPGPKSRTKFDERQARVRNHGFKELALKCNRRFRAGSNEPSESRILSGVRERQRRNARVVKEKRRYERSARVSFENSRGLAECMDGRVKRQMSKERLRENEVDLGITGRKSRSRVVHIQDRESQPRVPVADVTLSPSDRGHVTVKAHVSSIPPDQIANELGHHAEPTTRVENGRSGPDEAAGLDEIDRPVGGAHHRGHGSRMPPKPQRRPCDEGPARVPLEQANDPKSPLPHLAED